MDTVYNDVSNGPFIQTFNTPEGKLLRVNRSIQAEGTFALTKQDLDYRRFLCRGSPKVSAEWSLLAIAANILKPHY